MFRFSRGTKYEQGLTMVVLISVICLVLILGTVVGVILPRRRSRILEWRARQMGLSFQSTARPFEGTDVHGLAILDDGPAAIVENLLTRTLPPPSVSVFDLTFATESVVAVTTIAAFRSAAKLPVFQIGSKSVLERVEEALGKKCVHFDTDQEFSRNFYVHCSNDTEAQSFFTADRLCGLRQYAKRFHIESSPDWVLIYQPGRKVSPEHIAEFVENASAIASALLPTQLLPAAA